MIAPPDPVRLQIAHSPAQHGKQWDPVTASVRATRKREALRMHWPAALS
jgi:hypothetical protein